MSGADEEVPITARVAERPTVKPGKLRDVKPRHLGYRFLAGAVTSIVSGLLTLIFGARVGGIFLAFPAILAASLTLIEQQEDSVEAREDARGAVLGAVAMAAFAGVAAIALTSMSGALSLALATAAWFGVALVGYVVLWLR